METLEPTWFDTCLNCGEHGTDTDDVQGGLCEECFAAMPMETWLSPGSWDRVTA